LNLRAVRSPKVFCKQQSVEEEKDKIATQFFQIIKAALFIPQYINSKKVNVKRYKNPCTPPIQSEAVICITLHPTNPRKVRGKNCYAIFPSKAALFMPQLFAGVYQSSFQHPCWKEQENWC